MMRHISCPTGYTLTSIQESILFCMEYSRTLTDKILAGLVCPHVVTLWKTRRETIVSRGDSFVIWTDQDAANFSRWILGEVSQGNSHVEEGVFWAHRRISPK
jgi:hypothetical protein